MVIKIQFWRNDDRDTAPTRWMYGTMKKKMMSDKRNKRIV
jgi:hypothetical protein